MQYRLLYSFDEDIFTVQQTRIKFVISYMSFPYIYKHEYIVKFFHLLSY